MARIPSVGLLHFAPVDRDFVVLVNPGLIMPRLLNDPRVFLNAMLMMLTMLVMTRLVVINLVT